MPAGQFCSIPSSAAMTFLVSFDPAFSTAALYAKIAE